MSGPGEQPVYTGHDGTKHPRVRWDRGVKHRHWHSPPGGGSWMLYKGTMALLGATGVATPQMACPENASDQTIIRHQLVLPTNQTDTYAAIPFVQLQTVEIQYRRDLSDTLHLRLIRRLRSTGLATEVDSWTSGGGSPDFPVTVGTGDDIDELSLSSLQTLDPTLYDYYFELDMTAVVKDADRVSIGYFAYDIVTYGLVGT